MLAVALAAPLLSLDNFAVAAAMGLGGSGCRLRLLVALVFGGLAALAILAGGWMGSASAAWLGAVADQAGGFVLVALGAYQLLSTGGDAPGSPASAGRRIATARSLFLIGLGVSLDTVVAGVAFGLRGDPVIAAAGLVGAVTAVLSVVGLETGAHAGRRVLRADPRAAPLALILVGAGLWVGLL